MQCKVIRQGHSTKEVENEKPCDLTEWKIEILGFGYIDPVHRPKQNGLTIRNTTKKN